MKRLLPVSITLTTGFAIGFQLYSIIYLLPLLLEQLSELVALDLTLFSGFLVLVLSQFEIGKRLSQQSASLSIRDCLIGQSIAFIFFVMAPQAFWLIVAFVGWLTASSALQIALGRWTLLATNTDARRLESMLTLAGLAAGVAVAKCVPFFGGDSDFLIYCGLVVTALISFHVYLFGRIHQGYFSSSAAWFVRDLRRDHAGLALIGVSVCMGVMLGLLIFFHSKISPATAGIFGFLLLARRMFTAFHPEILVRIAIYAAALTLAVDALLWDRLTFGAYTLTFTASIIFTAVRVGGFAPRVMMSTSERMGLHGLGLMSGITLCGALSISNGMSAGRIMGTAAALLLIGSYLISFVPPTTRSTAAE